MTVVNEFVRGGCVEFEHFKVTRDNQPCAYVFRKLGRFMAGQIPRYAPLW